MQCVFCASQPDSHEHLSFECPYSQQVWHQVSVYAELQGSHVSYWNIVMFLKSSCLGKNGLSIVRRLVFGAALYYVWQEWNNRFFKKGKRSSSDLARVILDIVRFKLVSIKLGNSDED